MAAVVFLKGVNVGGHRTFRPSLLASRLAKHGVINIGAAGTFVVQKPPSRAKLLAAFRRFLPFETETTICSANDILRLACIDCFDGAPCGPDVVRFVSVLSKRPRVPPVFPLELPSGDDWLIRIIAIHGNFAFGLYRRVGRTIGAFSQLEKRLGASVTTRNWNTFCSLLKILRSS